MAVRQRVLSGLSALGLTVFVAAAVPAQTPTTGAPPARSSKPAKAAKTAWGDPDLQGIWTGSTITPLERPKQFADKAFLTDDEVAALERRTDQEGDKDRRDAKGTEADVRNAYNDFWWDRSTKVVPTQIGRAHV